MTVVDLRAETRAYGRARLRELALDAAREVVLERGWGAVRMGSIAASIGISRQSLHAEFGTKDDLGKEMVLRETEVFFTEMANRLAQHPGDLAGGVDAAARYVLTVAGENPLLQTILTQTPNNGGDASLLPLLTTRGGPLISRPVEIFLDWMGEHCPSVDRSEARLTAETIVRLGLSHILTPTQEPSDSARDIALVACRCLRLPDPA